MHTMRPQNMTHVWDSALDYHLDHSFSVFKIRYKSTMTGVLSVWWNVINGFPTRLGGLGFPLTRRVTHCHSSNATRQSQHPTTLTQVIRPFPNLCPRNHLSFCAAVRPLPSFFKMPMKLAHMYDHPIYTTFHHMLTLNLSSLQQHRLLGTNLACNHWLLSPT